MQIFGVLALRVQGIGGDDQTAQIGDGVEKCGEHRDLVALLADLDLTQHDPAVVVQARHHHLRPLLTVAGARSAFPSTATARRGDRPCRLPDVPARAALTRPDNQAPIAVSNPSPVNAQSARRIVDAFGAPIPIPHKVPSTASPTASAAHSAIAANDRAPETTAHTDTNRIAENRCRTPRFLRGSGTDSNTSSKPPRASGVTSPSGARWRDRTAIGDDDTAGTAQAPKITMA